MSAFLIALEISRHRYLLMNINKPMYFNIANRYLRRAVERDIELRDIITRPRSCKNNTDVTRRESEAIIVLLLESVLDQSRRHEPRVYLYFCATISSLPIDSVLHFKCASSANEEDESF